MTLTMCSGWLPGGQRGDDTNGESGGEGTENSPAAAALPGERSCRTPPAPHPRDRLTLPKPLWEDVHSRTDIALGDSEVQAAADELSPRPIGWTLDNTRENNQPSSAS